MSLLLLAALAVLAEPDPDGVVATAPATTVALDAAATAEPLAGPTAQDAQPHNLSTDQQIARWIAAREPAPSQAEVWVEPEDDRKPHGEVFVGVGTGGYRDVGASLSLPLGEDGRLSLYYRDSDNTPWAHRQHYLNDLEFEAERYRTPPGFGAPLRPRGSQDRPMDATD